MKRQSILLLLSVTLLVIIGVMLFSGCSCFNTERFTNPDLESSDNNGAKKVEFTKEELDLFDNIKNGKIDEQDMQNLIDSNVITEKLVEKFLQKIDDLPMPPAEGETKTAPAPKKKAAPAAAKEAPAPEDDVEPFCGDTTYASVA